MTKALVYYYRISLNHFLQKILKILALMFILLEINLDKICNTNKKKLKLGILSQLLFFYFLKFEFTANLNKITFLRFFD